MSGGAHRIPPRSLPHSGYLAHRCFNLGGEDVAPGALDDVFGAPGDKQLAVGDIDEVAAAQPVALAQGARRFGIPVVAFGGRRSTKLDVTSLAVGAQLAGAIEDTQFVARQWLAARCKLYRRIVVFGGGLGNANVHERCAPDAV